MASFLQQLARQVQCMNPKLKEPCDAYNPHRPSPRPEQSTLLEAFLECAMTLLLPVFIVIDAFDECSPSVREGILSLINSFCQHGFRVCVTTQPHLLNDLILSLPGNTVRLEISANREDVEAWADSRLPKRTLDPQLRANIVRTIGSQCDGL